MHHVYCETSSSFTLTDENERNMKPVQFPYF